MRSSLFWDVAHHLLVVTDVLGQPLLPVFKGKGVQKEMDYLTNEDRNSMLPELFITNCQLMPHDNPERSPIVIWIFYDHMTVHRNKFLMNKTKRCTEFQFYWYYYSTCFGQPFCLSSGVLSRTSALVHFMQLWWPFVTRSRMELILLLVANGHHNCIKCAKADVRLRTPDDGQKGCPKHVES